MRWRSSFVGLLLSTALSWAAAIDVNVATEAQLDAINGIGPAMSRRILQARERAAFANWSDFMQRVSGIGLKKATQLSSQGLTVNGKNFASPAPSAEPVSDSHR